MIYENDVVRDMQIAYIGGGSRRWARTFITDLTMEPRIRGTMRLYDIDAEAAEADETIRDRLSQGRETVDKWIYRTCMSMRGALAGAGFIVISVLPGTFDEMTADVRMPERLGICQSVGDTARPGDMIRTLHTIPIYVEFTEAIRQYAPDAWVINYTSPISLCVKTLYHVFPQIKALGCYHEVPGTQKVLKGIAEDVLGLKHVDRKGIQVNALGINHFTWFDYASYKEIDLFPIYRKYMDEHFEGGCAEHDANQASTCFACAYRVKFDLLRRYGLIAAAGDRYLAEFTPGNEYLKDPEAVEKWKFTLTSVDWRKEDLKNRLEKSRRLLDGEKEINLEPSGGERILLVKALCGLERVVSNVNIPNTSLQIGNLPVKAVVETDTVFERNVIRPILAGPLPEYVREFIMSVVGSHEAILEAALTCNEGLVVRTFMNDPQVKGGKCREQDIRQLIKDMLDGTKKYLPKGWKQDNCSKILLNSVTI